MDEIVSQVKRAMLKIAAHANESPIYVCGHSAGAHLAAMMLLNDRLAMSIRGFLLVSGVFDLTPIVRTYVNDNLCMTVEDARRLSPMFVTSEANVPMKHRPNIQVLLACAQNDSFAFKTQSLKYFDVYNKSDS